MLNYSVAELRIKIKRPAHLSIVERLGGFWRVQRYEKYSKPAIFKEFFNLARIYKTQSQL